MEKRTFKTTETIIFGPEFKDIYDVLKPIVSSEKVKDDKVLFLRTIKFYFNLNDCQSIQLSKLYTELRDIYKKDYLEIFLAQDITPTDFLIMDDRNFISLVKSTFSNENTKLGFNYKEMQEVCKIFLDIHLVTKREIIPKHIFDLIDAYEQFHQNVKRIHHEKVVIYKNLQKAVIDLIREYRETKSQEVSILLAEYTKYLEGEKQYQEEIIKNKHSFYSKQSTEINYNKIVIMPGQLKCRDDEACNDQREKQNKNDYDDGCPSFLKVGDGDDDYSLPSFLDPKYLKETIKKQKIQKGDDINDDLSVCTLPSVFDDNDQKKNP